MQDLRKRAEDLGAQIRTALERLSIAEVEEKLTHMRAEAEKPDFWENSENAQEQHKEIAKLDKKVQPWRELERDAEELIGLIELNDVSLATDLEQQLTIAEERFAAKKKELAFSGPYDESDVIVSIYAGAGGTDAQDWAQMLLRMYLRWAEIHNYATRIMDESPGEEAGIKSVTFEINGDLMYGRLKGEHGVHRLVRLSPFNADSLRQTSFAKVDVLPKISRPEAVELDEKDLKVDVYRSSGKGGQSVNTTDSAVRITHVPTGITVAIQNERSQLQNKETALTLLRSRLARLQLEQHAEKLSELKGPNEQAAWGNQIRSYVLHPYKQVKDLRTRYESSDPGSVLNGELDNFLEAYQEVSPGSP